MRGLWIRIVIFARSCWCYMIFEVNVYYLHHLVSTWKCFMWVDLFWVHNRGYVIMCCNIYKGSMYLRILSISVYDFDIDWWILWLVRSFELIRDFNSLPDPTLYPSFYWACFVNILKNPCQCLITNCNRWWKNPSS